MALAEVGSVSAEIRVASFEICCSAKDLGEVGVDLGRDLSLSVEVGMV